MTDFNITVRVDPTVAERGIRRVDSGLNRLNNSADRTRRLLQTAFATVGVVALGRSVLSLVDTFTNLQNRLRTVTTGTTQLNQVTQQLFVISQNTRASFQATAELYSRVALATRELGVSQETTLQFTESLNQAIILSGASATEAQAGLIQLSQGLASGTLRGDELRSVLEQLPVVADVIADSLGVTRGELRELGSEGKISAEIVIDAFRQARGELQENFAKSVSTVGQAFTVLNNSLIVFGGNIDEATGFSEKLVSVIVNLSLVLDTLTSDRLASLLEILGQIALIVGVGLGFGPLLAILTRLGSIVVATGKFIGGLAHAMTSLTRTMFLAGAAMIQFSKVLTKTPIGITAAAITGVLVVALNLLGVSLGDVLSAWEEAWLRIEVAASNAIDVFRGDASLLIAGLKEGQNALIDLASILTNTMNSTAAAVRTATTAAQEFAATAAPLLNRFGQGVPGVLLRNLTSDNLSSAGDFLNDLLFPDIGIAPKRAPKPNRRGFIPFRDAPEGGSGGGLGTQAPTFDESTERLREEVELLRVSNSERQVRAAQLQIERRLQRDLGESEKVVVGELTKEADLLRRMNTILNNLQGPQQDYEQGLEAINRLLAEGKINTDQFTDATNNLRLRFLESQQGLQAGLETSLLRMGQDTGKFADNFSRVFDNAFRGAETALSNFVTTGKADFGSLVDSIIKDLSKLAIQATIINPLKSFLSGGSGGGGFGGFGSIFGSLFGGGGSSFSTGATPFAFSSVGGFAQGGFVRGPGSGTSDSIPARLSNGEFVVNARAASRNAGLLNSINGGGGGPAATAPVNITINNTARDTQTRTEESTGSDGSRQINVIIEETVGRQLDNGRFDRQLGNRFGIRPQTTGR